MTKDEALKMAVEEMFKAGMILAEALQACKEALALSEKQHTFPDKKQPAQEPVAERFLMKDKGKSYWAYSDYDNSKDWQPLYTHPCALAHTAPSWNELSEVEINALADFWNISDIDIKEFIKKIERMSREMNT